MKYIVWFIFMFIHLSDGECPKATFEFNHNTKKISYTFIDSSVGNIGSLETCPYTGRPYVYLPCYPNSSWGNEPYYSTCVKPPDKQEEITTSISSTINPYFQLSIDEIAKLPINTSNEISNIISYLNQDTMIFKSSLDVISAVDIINRLIMNNQDIDDKIQSNFYSIVNKILSSNSIHQAQKFNKTIVKLLSSLDIFTQNIKTNEFNQNFNQNNLAISIVNMPNNRTQSIIGFTFDSTTNQTSVINSNDNIRKDSTFITLDSEVISQQNRMIFSVYNHQNDLFDEEQYHVLTRIVSLIIDKPKLINKLENFVKINFYLEIKFQKND